MKGRINEGDKSRDILIRELARQKELESEKIRELDLKREVDIKLLEKVMHSLQRDK